jgi:hypothetical protein
MLLALLAAATAAATAPADLPPPKTVSPLVVTAQPKEAPPVDVSVSVTSNEDSALGQYVAVWPAGAWERRMDGHVVLTCLVDVHGLAEQCRVAFEKPAGRGFGTAALELQPTLKLTPLKGADGQPVAAKMNIGLEFRAPNSSNNLQDLASAAKVGGDGGINAANLAVSQNPISMRDIVMMNHPVWVEAPSFEDLAKAYPRRGGGVEGYAVAHCEVERTGFLNKCIASKELPAAKGFGPAAIALAHRFKVSAEVMKYAPHGAPIEVDIPIRFPAPGAEDRTVSAPAWLAGFDPEQVPKLFPPEAAAKGLTSGRGVAKCLVTPDGSLADCAPDAADPDGMGFSEAAVKLAATMRMNLWSADAQPVEGGTVRVAIRLNLDRTHP